MVEEQAKVGAMLNMRDIDRALLPAYIFGYASVAIVHLFGLILLYLVRFKPANQRLLLLNLACTGVCSGIVQTIVYSFLLSNCNSDCDLVDTFFNVFLQILNKAIMIYLILDRALEIYLNIKYPLYFKEKTMEKVLGSLWIFSAVFIFVLVLFLKFCEGSKEHIYLVMAGVYLAEDVIIFISALSTGTYFYIKVRALLAMDSHYLDTKSNFTKTCVSKFALPFLIIITYLLFNITGDVMYQFGNLSNIDTGKRTNITSYVTYQFGNLSDVKRGQGTLSEVSHLLWILGWLADAILYIFLQKSVRTKLAKIFAVRSANVLPHSNNSY